MIKINGQEIEFSKFPNGETKVDIPLYGSIDKGTTFTVELKYQSDDDLIHLLFVKDYLVSKSKKPIDLVVKYFPYSRMDRRGGNSAFTLQSVATFINSMNFNSVNIFDAHSDVAPALINNVIVSSKNYDFFREITRVGDYNSSTDYVYFPDTGAEKRYFPEILPYQYATGNKHRNFKTGKIESLHITATKRYLDGTSENIKKLNSENVLMVDDLCSYGGTFILGAEKLKEIGAGKIFLFVSHCEDSIFNGKILTTDLIEHVYTTDSILTKTHEKITLI